MTSTRPGIVDRAADPAVEAELERLPKMPIVELRRRYRELFRAEPPKRSVRICFGAASRTGFRSGPMAASRGSISVCWISW